jgi:enoyl-CoA hydratase/carnithine racemase
MIKELHRFLESYCLDDMVNMVWMKSTDPTMFSKGTDLKYLLFKVKEKHEEEAVSYLRDVQ